jgi:chromate transporter
MAMEGSGRTPPPADTHPGRVPARDLFLTFTQLTLHSFGGAMFWSRRMFVERRRWLTEQEFVDVLSLAQLLPGANGVNMAVIIGYRLAGFTGAAASLAGFIAAPCLVIAALAMLHKHFGSLPVVRDALAGMSMVAVGLIVAMALKMAKVLGRRAVPWMFAAAAFAGVGIMRWPLLAVLGALAPFAIAAAWKGKH